MEPALQDDDAKNGPRNEWARMKLREIAADIEAEPIPDRFASLRPIGHGLQALRDKHAAGEASLAGVITAGAFRSARPQR